ncbi:c-type cytochrome biogenesis protein CcsB [Micromonospora aurantiaca]|jgi:cytochrome c-type biogenesis protein CcsB|uniref:C-type cytochrome biogenesis protein CcsB n=1 Tax=Micromonospora aurantiaca (nom. illeg.) TaxID=47850 RepID=A0A3M9JZ96_9ACTN|nr:MULTISPECIES: c-type cytochrome biogenesis protein CcsB [Micromonospora]ADU09700.1 cytochrome c-type biogenesis protein CcsB [Micromonospora sp. L5]AXH93674.1 c-type cytochrome biogenesis protein CcsB [Micromonospora aurantiaca]KAB1108440.1 c-type cytochrome biogenesis protein CcsB [Micromonospora aurantiaca]MBC9004361.1 c-type cytochrome biogenesis protein CcsB [Micromonospora aurantiaca]MDG4752853.1 c-type cytochrome biogenesis protein CcsB [Micromonospora sp. WMMD718]
MAALSDQLLIVTLLAYLVAMVGYATEHAFRRSHAVPAVDTRLPAMATTTTAGPPTGPPPTSTRAAASTSATAPGSRSRLAGWLAVAATGAGAVAHASCLVTRGLAADRVPWGNMYEFVLAVTLVGVLAWLGLLTRRPAVRPVGLYIALAAVTLLGLAAMRLHTPAGPLVPALDSYWLKIHVSAAAIASGIFLIGFIAATGYLIRLRHDRDTATNKPYGFVSALGRYLPATETLERLTFQMHALAFPIWTFAVVAGAIWAEAAWGRYWGWDPKETWSFISWVIYAGYLHARATPSVKRPVVAWLAILGWATMMFNLFAVNLVIAGLHSYAGTN